jgi:hypothetical protein
MGVDRCVAGCACEIFVLFVRNMLVGFWVTVFFAQAKVYQMDYVRFFAQAK